MIDENDLVVPDNLRRALDLRERIIWWGRPKRGLRWQADEATAIPFAMAWCSFIGFWEYGAISVIPFPGNIVFSVFGLPFIAAGLYMMPGRYILDAAARKRTVYGLTDRRIIIITELFGRTTASHELDSIGEMTVETKSNGYGTIALGLDDVRGSGEDVTRIAAPRIDLIRDPDAIYWKITAARDALRRAEAAAAQSAR